MKVYIDGSATQTCYVFEGEEAVIKPLPIPSTGNVGEYCALIVALQEAERRCYWDIEIFSDSQLLVNQINSRLHPTTHQPFYWTKNQRLLKLGDLVLPLMRNLDATLRWLSREENIAGKVLG